MQRGEHQVSGLGSGDRGLDRLQVPHLAHQDHVGVLAEDVLEGGGEGAGVRTDLPLVHHRCLVMMEVLDGILDGHDVHGSFVVDHVEERRQRR